MKAEIEIEIVDDTYKIHDNFNNDRSHIFGPYFGGIEYLMLKSILSSELKITNRKIKFLTRCPKRYPDYHTEEEVSTIDEYRDSVVVFDDMLENKQ